MKHHEASNLIAASPEDLFSFLDDHSHLSSHMNKSSWMMGGGRMDTSLDEGRGQKVGSHIVMEGKAFGMPIFLDEVITLYESPRKKEWETVGAPKLVVMGSYRMGFEIVREGNKSRLRVFIDYDMPPSGTRFLGYLFGGSYAQWCVKQILDGCSDYFNKNR